MSDLASKSNFVKFQDFPVSPAFSTSNYGLQNLGADPTSAHGGLSIGGLAPEHYHRCISWEWESMATLTDLRWCARHGRCNVCATAYMLCEGATRGFFSLCFVVSMVNSALIGRDDRIFGMFKTLHLRRFNSTYDGIFPWYPRFLNETWPTRGCRVYVYAPQASSSRWLAANSTFFKLPRLDFGSCCAYYLMSKLYFC